ncbi:MAG: putative selenate reductase subunit YgfK, partial [Spirochaetes bacterium]|nr:putative selenate reductase subunit YgfK [Spirochaetota bacterium]
MSDIMRPIPFEELLNRIFSEYKNSQSIFGISEQVFFRKANNKTAKISGESCETVLGPAAGPHTQLAQNIVASYLCGGRFIELKTIQIMDTLEIEKPCIDAEDECYNTEWSSEYTVEKAADEYIKAWIILHLLEELFDLKKQDKRSFIFNMSVGYDLKGIQSPKVDNFINTMRDASINSQYQKYLDQINAFIKEET